MTEALTRFAPTRAAALERLSTFLPHAGSDYAARRNYDLGRDSHNRVSCLSPYIRNRLLTEEEVLKAVLGQHSSSTAEKFIQEVFWRTYWKGWLELRPKVWQRYQTSLRTHLDDVHTQNGLRDRWEAACKGETDIDCFNAWAQELVETGYMHNHARMWFASIWIFTLHLPWELGADFFLRHLIDGDPASNTLSWRWVAGLQTAGKTYLATPSNIEKYTEGRFPTPTGLATEAKALKGDPTPERQPLPDPQWMEPGKRTGLLLHDDDMSPGYMTDAGLNPVATAMIENRARLSPLHVSKHVKDFARAALRDTDARWGQRLGPISQTLDTTEIAEWAEANRLEQIVTPYAPVGPSAAALRALSLTPGLPPVRRIARPYDRNAWPHASAGFFRFKDKIPKLLGQLMGNSVFD